VETTYRLQDRRPRHRRRPGVVTSRRPNLVPTCRGKGAWITKAGLIHSRSEIAVGEVNGKMYVLGGYADGNVAQPLNEEYDPGTDTWRERAPLPRGGNHIAAVGLNGKLYAIGGFTLQNANS
jgi:N-acetylneuraminic acid mutarotase